MTYQDILSKQYANILITGDSLSYNRYDYDSAPRMNAFDCGVGMPSWSFVLRDMIYQADRQFLFGDQIQFGCEVEEGIANDSSVPYTAMFGGRIRTLMPEGDVSFIVPIENNSLTLYLQKRVDASCTFDIYVDECIAKEHVNTQGDMEEFAGYGLMTISLPCDSNKKMHTVAFKNICGDSQKITVAGVGAKYTNIILNGRGSQCVRFFIENFEERIGKHTPDLIIMSLGANDRASIAPGKFRADLIELFSALFQRFPHCKVLFLLPPSAHNPTAPDEDILPYVGMATAEIYDRTIEQVCKSYDIDTLRISSLFVNDMVSTWRYDNIHMNRYGNEILLQAVAQKIKIIKKEED